MTYNNGTNVLARNSNFELHLFNVNLHSWKLVNISIITMQWDFTLYYIHIQNLFWFYFILFFVFSQAQLVFKFKLTCSLLICEFLQKNANDWDMIGKDIMPMSMPPTLKVISYQTMYSYGNHIHVSSVEENLTSYNKWLWYNGNFLAIIHVKPPND